MLNFSPLTRHARKLLLLSLLAPTGLLVHAQDGTEAAWKSFYANDRNQARTLFQKAAQQPASKAEAHLGLSLLATIDRTGEEAFNEYARFAGSQPNSYPYTFALWGTESVMAGGGRKSPAQITFLKNLAKDPNANGTMLAMAHSMLGNHFEAINNLSAAENEYKQLGAITDWQLVGEFENISASGFHKDYGPVKQADAKNPFINKNGASVSWFNLPAYRHDRWIDFTYHFYTHNSVIYAQTFVSSPADQEVQLRTGVSGSLKAWVNDKLVLSEAEERNNDLDTYLTKIKLNKGYNRILIQVGESYANRSNFMARITDAAGKPVSGLAFSKAPQAYTAETGYQASSIPVFAEEYFEQLIKKEPNKAINYVLLGQTYLRQEKTFEARKAFLAAQKLAPESSYILSLLLQVYSKEDNRTQTATSLEWLKDHDPENPLSLNLLYRDEFAKENYENAAVILGKIEKFFGNNENVLYKKMELATANKQSADIIKLAEQAYAQYPNNPYFVKLKYLVEKSVRNNTAGSASLMKSFLKRNDNYSNAELLAGDYFERGNVAEGLKLYGQALAGSPVAVGIQHKIGNIYSSLQNYKKAEEAYNKTLVISPYIGSYWADLGRTKDALGNKTEAINCYKKAIELNPSDYSSIKELRKLEGKKDVFEHFPAVDVYALAKAAPAAAAYPEDKGLIVHDEVQRVVYPGGASEEKRIFVVKVLNTKGLEDWKEYSISYHNYQRLLVEKAEVIKANGTKVPAETNGNDIVFTNLEVGDAIHVTHRLQTYLEGQLAAHFWDKYYFTHGMPYLTTKYSLLIAPGVKFQYKVNQGPLEPKKTKADNDFELYVWEKTQQGSLKPEDKMPVLADIGQTLYLSSIPDWNFVANWYSDLASSKAKADFEVKEVVSDLFKGKENLSAEAKVKAIYDYIITNISYSSVSFRQSGLVPQKAATVLNTRIGDCKDVSTLFVAMCKEAGIDASLVLVNTRENGLYDMELPTIEFNHCIAKVEIDNKPQYVELTSSYLPFGSLYSSSLNSRILEIGTGNNAQLGYLNFPTRKPNAINRKTEISIKDKDIAVKQTNIRTASMAAFAKERSRNLSTKEREKQTLDGLKTLYPTVTLNKLQYTGLESTADTVINDLEFTASNVITEVGGLSLFTLPWSNKAIAADFVLEDDRQFPIDLTDVNFTDKETETIAITLPANKTLAEVPKTIKYSCAYADYTLSCKLVNKTLVFTRELQFKKDLIPAGNVTEFRKFYNNVITADARQIALK
ncbi:DUF3857 domain-containing protein [Adhaeribacter soli]|uniref:Tetratricopeptide repeat protein n=1 Tax=Adhaeribacter soli TaxID=2607655 RepID=A0A5N1IP53_9BACT|nr:DUF3857 domain-containing protein [Adhaeribacter soli]KAA9331794.1 tetratricopeptide repeat protein [Adhaeribacter soli]